MIRPDVSIVIPLHNERETLAELHSQLVSSLDRCGKTHEIIFVDDGSTDGSWEIIRSLSSASNSTIGIKFRRNFRKSAALAAGFSRARGAVIVTIDADLQDSPASIPDLLAKLDEGYDLVSGWKQERKDAATKLFASRIFNLITSSVTGIRLHDFNCGLKAYRRNVIDDLHLYGDLHRFIPVLADQYGYRIGEVKVPHFARRYGTSHFSGFRLVEGFFDILTVCFLTRYLHKPSRVFGCASMLASVGVVILLAIGWTDLGAHAAASPTLVPALIVLASAVQLFSVSLIAEMLTHLSSGSRSVYAIEEMVGGSEP